ncbi:MAG: hypothetical protein K0V04_18595 [Deltaproteobacteria bacterium]|nr:hypothetical protein [Deltaproteobacteria bacterium]
MSKANVFPVAAAMLFVAACFAPPTVDADTETGESSSGAATTGSVPDDASGPGTTAGPPDSTADGTGGGSTSTGSVTTSDSTTTAEDSGSAGSDTNPTTTGPECPAGVFDRSQFDAACFV